MDPVATAVLASWTLDLKALCLLLAVAALYLRGWLRLRVELPSKYTTGRMAAFGGGLLAVLLALESPVDTFGGLLLQAHMIQHLMLIMVAPPLLLLGCRYCVACRDGCSRKHSGHSFPAENSSKSVARSYTRSRPGSLWRLLSSSGTSQDFTNWDFTRKRGIGLSMHASFGRPCCFGGR
jgi:hypothetical protein